MKYQQRTCLALLLACSSIPAFAQQAPPVGWTDTQIVSVAPDGSYVETLDGKALKLKPEFEYKSFETAIWLPAQQVRYKCAGDECQLFNLSRMSDKEIHDTFYAGQCDPDCVWQRNYEQMQQAGQAIGFALGVLIRRLFDRRKQQQFVVPQGELRPELNEQARAMGNYYDAGSDQVFNSFVEQQRSTASAYCALKRPDCAEAKAEFNRLAKAACFRWPNLYYYGLVGFQVCNCSDNDNPAVNSYEMCAGRACRFDPELEAAGAAVRQAFEKETWERFSEADAAADKVEKRVCGESPDLCFHDLENNVVACSDQSILHANIRDSRGTPCRLDDELEFTVRMTREAVGNLGLANHLVHWGLPLPEGLTVEKAKRDAEYWLPRYKETLERVCTKNPQLCFHDLEENVKRCSER